VPIVPSPVAAALNVSRAVIVSVPSDPISFNDAVNAAAAASDTSNMKLLMFLAVGFVI
jgi:hypothetical protein